MSKMGEGVARGVATAIDNFNGIQADNGVCLLEEEEEEEGAALADAMSLKKNKKQQ